MASSSSALPPIPLPVPPPPSHNIHRPSLFTVSPPPNPTLKTPSVRSRLSRLCQEGQPQLARQLFDTIPRPTAVVCNTIIIGFICNHMPLDALLFYAQLKNDPPHTQFDSYTYSSTLKACADTRNLKVGKAIHCHLIRCLSYPSRIVYNSLLNMYSTCLPEVDHLNHFHFSKYDAVRNVFNSMKKRDVVAWNTLVSWYVKTERYVEAIRHFRVMMKMGVKPSPVSFVNVFPALSSAGDDKNASVLFGMLLSLGSEYVKDSFVVSSAIFMYAELGRLNFARKIFDHCLEKNTEVWNTMIGGYVQSNHFFDGIDLFVLAIKEQIVLDNVTFLSALTAVSQLQSLDLAKQLHAYVIKNLTSLPVIILNAIIVMYSRCNAVHTSFAVFEKMLERDVVSWNTMISAFVQNEMDDEGLMLVYEMQNHGFAIDSVTVTAILSAASNLRNYGIGKQIHAYILRHHVQFEGMDSYLIDMYAKSGLIRTSQLIFEKNYMNNRDQATWNAMIAGYTQHGLSGEAFVTFKWMTEQNVMPNAVTIASILPACNLLGTIDLGKQLHGVSIRLLLDQNVFVSTALIDMYSKSGAINHAETVFTQSSERNSVTYTTMIMGYGLHGMGEKALSLFHSMQKSVFRPDSITFVAVLSACSYTGLVDEGLQIFQSMQKDYKIQPTTQHYCCVTDMLGRDGRVVDAYEFVRQLGEDGNLVEIWGSLLGACKLHGHIELGKIIAKKLLDMEVNDSLAGYRVLLSNIYAKEGNWENVDRVRKEMREKGLRKEVGCSWIDVGGFVTRFVSKDQSHPQHVDIYDILEGLHLEMKGSEHNSRVASH